MLAFFLFRLNFLSLRITLLLTKKFIFLIKLLSSPN